MPSTSAPPAATIRSPRSIPARSAGLSASTSRTSRPSRSGRPTARRSRLATRGGATATPSRCGVGALPRASSRAAAPAGTARMSPPSMRRLFRPRRRPSRSTSGPPDEPRGRVAVCSMAPFTRRPRGPRKLRPSDEMKPSVARRPRPPGLASATTGLPMGGASRSGSQATAGALPVSTSSRARSRSALTPTVSPVSRRPSAKETVTSSRRRLWAFVSTWPSPTTTPEPRPQPRPSPTTDGPTRSAAPPIASPSSATALIRAPISHLQHRGDYTTSFAPTIGVWQRVPTRRWRRRWTASAIAGRCFSWRRYWTPRAASATSRRSCRASRPTSSPSGCAASRRGSCWRSPTRSGRSVSSTSSPPPAASSRER